MNDQKYMAMAMDLALKAKNTASPNPMVGAVIVKNGRVIAQGFHHHAGGPHAEVIAFQKASSSQLKGATLYVTLEPCAHFGRTPPCVDAVIKAGIKKIVVGMKDPNPKTNGHSILKLRKAGINVSVGILEEELRKMNASFVKYVTKQIPFVVAKTAQTLDGRIATRTSHSKWITSQASRKLGHELRNEFDAIMVGIQTVLKDDPGLNAALESKRLKKVIVDSCLRIPLNAKLFRKTRPEDCIVTATKRANKTKLKQLQKRGVQIIFCPLKNGRVDLKFLLKELAKREIAKVLIEGGGTLIGSALKEKVVDKVLIFVAPQILGDEKGLPSVRGLAPRHIDQSVKLREVSFQKIGEDFLIEGKVE